MAEYDAISSMHDAVKEEQTVHTKDKGTCSTATSTATRTEGEIQTCVSPASDATSISKGTEPEAGSDTERARARLEAKLAILVPLLRLGENVNEEVILLLTPIALRLSKRLSIHYPTEREDLRAQAKFGLVQAVSWASSRLVDDNIIPYAIVTIRRFIWDWIASIPSIPVPKDEKKRLITSYVKDGFTEDEAKEKFYKYLATVTPGSIQAPSVSTNEETNPNEPPVEDQDSYGAKELEKLLNLSFYEKALLALRSEGYTVREMSPSLNKHHSVITRDLEKIRQRYRHLQRRHQIYPAPPNEYA